MTTHTEPDPRSDFEAERGIVSPARIAWEQRRHVARQRRIAVLRSRGIDAYTAAMMVVNGR